MALSGRVTERLGGGLTSLIGGTITIVATIPFVLIEADTSFLLISAAMIVRGFGIGMSMMPSMTAAYAVLRPDQINDATPQLNVLQRVGGSIGTAILTVVLQSGISGLATPSPAGIAGAFGDTYYWVLGISLVALAAHDRAGHVERRAKAERRAAARRASRWRRSHDRRRAERAARRVQRADGRGAPPARPRSAPRRRDPHAAACARESPRTRRSRPARSPSAPS